MPISVWAAKAKNDELRTKSSSGGIFSLLARQVISQGGVVYGAGFDHDDWHVTHKSAESEEELEDLRGSKYVQSDIRGVYAAVKTNLVQGREVLFAGTPCQIAGLRKYLLALDVDAVKLRLVDVVCHAVPSPFVWEKHLKTLVDALTGGCGSAQTVGRNIRRISFRHKNCGWKRYSLSLRLANDEEYLADLRTDPFLRGFMHELYNRPSCHNCQCRELRSGADITLADYWRVHEKFPEMDDDKGTSLVLVNTEAGDALMGKVRFHLSEVESDFADAVRVNPSIVRSVSPHQNRAKFFSKMYDRPFSSLVEEMLRHSLCQRIVLYAKKTMKRCLTCF